MNGNRKEISSPAAFELHKQRNKIGKPLIRFKMEKRGCNKLRPSFIKYQNPEMTAGLGTAVLQAMEKEWMATGAFLIEL